MSEEKVLVLEAFYGGSHRQLTDYILKILQDENVSTDFISMTDKKWHWRSRTSALYFAEQIPHQNFSVIFTSSTTNLTELIGLRSDLVLCRKVIYFHENQLVYPVRKEQERDFQYGYNQIISCITADVVLFNSKYNMESFLSNISKHFKTMPDYRPKLIKEKIRKKCKVLYFPLSIPTSIMQKPVGMHGGDNTTIHIVWPHRWEHDKNPSSFFEVMTRLHEENINFKLSVVGQSYTEVPDVFEMARDQLSDHIINFGYQQSKEAYKLILMNADVVVSTAHHEFFGVSMLEAVAHGCYPLCPNRLVYPEIFPDTYLYNTDNQLFKKLKTICKYPETVRKCMVQIDISKFEATKLKPSYLAAILEKPS